MSSDLARTWNSPAVSGQNSASSAVTIFLKSFNRRARRGEPRTQRNNHAQTGLLSAGALKMRLQEAFSLLLNELIRMRNTPVSGAPIKLEKSMPGRAVGRFHHELQRDFICRIVDNHKTHCITRPLRRQSWTRCRISQIARLELFGVENSLFFSRSATPPSPA